MNTFAVYLAVGMAARFRNLTMHYLGFINRLQINNMTGAATLMRPGISGDRGW